MRWRALITSWKCAWKFAYIWFGEGQWLVLTHLISKYFWHGIMKPTWIYLTLSYKANNFSNFDYPIFHLLLQRIQCRHTPSKKDTVHHSLENHLAALYIFIMSQADTYKSLICVISLLQLHSHHYILDWCCRNKRPQQNYTVNPVSVMDHHCGWPLKLCRFILARLNLNGILSVSTGALDKDETN